MTRQKTLYIWLMSVGLAHALGGILLIVFVDTELGQVYFNYLAGALNASNSQDLVARALLKLFGPTVASWGILFCVAVDYYYTSGKQLIKWTALFAILMWLLLDSGISAYYGLYWHWLINGLAAVSMIIPLLLIKPKNLDFCTN